jgi:hypothetical protein
MRAALTTRAWSAGCARMGEAVRARAKVGLPGRSGRRTGGRYALRIALAPEVTTSLAWRRTAAVDAGEPEEHDVSSGSARCRATR